VATNDVHVYIYHSGCFHFPQLSDQFVIAKILLRVTLR